VPLFDHAGAIVNVLAAAFDRAGVDGAAVSVALLLRLKLPVLASVLLIAPRKEERPGVGKRPVEKRVGGDGDGAALAGRRR